MRYIVVVAKGPNKFFRSLASAVKYILENGLGIVQFPSNQAVSIRRVSSNEILVSHTQHPSSDEFDERDDENPGIDKVARIVKRFVPGSRIEIQYSHDPLLDQLYFEKVDPNFYESNVGSQLLTEDE